MVGLGEAEPGEHRRAGQWPREVAREVGAARVPERIDPLAYLRSNRRLEAHLQGRWAEREP
jgi:hypothetical protein